MQRINARGNSLVVTLTATAVMAVLVVGAIRYTGTNREAASSKIRADEATACAETARRHLLSQLRLFGSPIETLQLDRVNKTNYKRLNDAVATADQTIMSISHYDEDPLTAPLSTGVVPANAFSAARASVQEVQNTIRPPVSGGYFRVVMKCQLKNPVRESELEFVFKYGL
jgi:hypothetical protein